MPKKLALTLLMLVLTASAWAGVVSGPEDIPGDPDVPPPKWKVEALERQAQGETAGSATTRPGPQPGSRPGLSDSSGTGSAAVGTAPTPMETPGTGEEEDLPAVPGGQSTWPLIAIAVLLLLFAGGGGYYFYATRED